MFRPNFRFALLGILLWNAGTSDAAEIDRERAAGIMSAYLPHIASFTHWPGDEAARADQPIVIGQVGTDPNGVIRLISDRTTSAEGLLVRSRPIRVVVLEETVADGGDLEALSACAMLFLSEGAEEPWQKLQPLVQSLPIVTISEMDGFVDRGGMIEYFIDRQTGKVRMKVNLSAMRDAGISFSARFLALKSVVLLGEREEA